MRTRLVDIKYKCVILLRISLYTIAACPQPSQPVDKSFVVRAILSDIFLVLKECYVMPTISIDVDSDSTLYAFCSSIIQVRHGPRWRSIRRSNKRYPKFMVQRRRQYNSDTLEIGEKGIDLQKSPSKEAIFDTENMLRWAILVLGDYALLPHLLPSCKPNKIGERRRRGMKKILSLSLCSLA